MTRQEGAAIAAGAAAVFAVFLTVSWFVMILAGVLHAEVSASIPAFGYLGANAVVVAGGFLVALFSPRA